jgi:hypothetical protein
LESTVWQTEGILFYGITGVYGLGRRAIFLKVMKTEKVYKTRWKNSIVMQYFIFFNLFWNTLIKKMTKNR